MKNKMTTMTYCRVSAVGIAFLCWAGTAAAQNPSIHPAGKSKVKETEAQASGSPASAAKKPALSAKDKRFVSEAAKGGYQWIGEKERADQCVDCGECEQACPQHLPIRQDLKRVAAALGA